MAGDILRRAKGAYVTAAQSAGSALTRAGVLPADAPDRDRRLKHWAYSLTKVHDSVAMARIDVPWWTYRAIDVVDARLAARAHSARVFEYGSGASTLWLAGRADKIVSVEHHRGFGQMIERELAGYACVRIEIVEPTPTDSPRVGSRKEGHAGLDFADYVATIDRVGGTFDLIIIDGRAREACLAAALPHLAGDGIVVFDNTRRRRYREAIARLAARDGLAERRLPGLTPTLPYPDQTSIITRRRQP